MSAEVVGLPVLYGVELVDGLTKGPLVGRNEVMETSTGIRPFLVNRSRWVFPHLPAAPATFAITTHYYVNQTLTTGTPQLPNPTGVQPGFLATVTMMPRTGYPFSPTLTRVVGLVLFANAPVPNAKVTLTPSHKDPVSGTIVNDSPVQVTTTDDGQYTYWFLPVLSHTPPIANQAQGTVSDGAGHTGTIPLTSLIANGVTSAPTVLLT